MSDNEKKIFKIGDDLIAVIRELVQLSLITGTSIVDHIRAIHVEIDSETGKLVPTERYVEAYNAMVSQLQEQAESAVEKQAAEIAAKELNISIK